MGLDGIGRDWEYVRYAPADVNGQRTATNNRYSESGERGEEGRKEGAMKEQKRKIR